MFIVFFVACLWGTSDDAPETVPPPVDAPAPTATAQPTEAEPAPAATPKPVVIDPALQAMTDATAATSVAKAMPLYSEATTSAELEAAYAAAIDAADALTEWARDKESLPNEDDILAKTPGLAVGWFAEGTVAVFSLDPEAWKAKAATTPTGDDDAFFALTDYAYSQGNPGGWAVWQMRNWDYGGCSGLGKGMVLETLKKAQQVTEAGSAFAEPTAYVRAEAIDEITRESNSAFPRCDVMTVEPTPDAVLQQEAQQVLDTITLTDAEREAITAALPKLTGEVFQGG